MNEDLPELLAIDLSCRTDIFEHYTKLVYILSDKVKDGTIY